MKAVCPLLYPPPHRTSLLGHHCPFQSRLACRPASSPPPPLPAYSPPPSLPPPPSPFFSSSPTSSHSSSSSSSWSSPARESRERASKCCQDLDSDQGGEKPCRWQVPLAGAAHAQAWGAEPWVGSGEVGSPGKRRGVQGSVPLSLGSSFLTCLSEESSQNKL